MQTGRLPSINCANACVQEARADNIRSIVPDLLLFGVVQVSEAEFVEGYQRSRQIINPIY